MLPIVNEFANPTCLWTARMLSQSAAGSMTAAMCATPPVAGTHPSTPSDQRNIYRHVQQIIRYEFDKFLSGGEAAARGSLEAHVQSDSIVISFAPNEAQNIPSGIFV